MILNKSQLVSVTKYNKLLSEGKSKTEAAASLNIPRKTIARWVEADNAPAAPTVKPAVKAPVPVAKPTVAPRGKVTKLPVTPRLGTPVPGTVPGVTVDTGPIDNDVYERIAKIVVEQLGVDRKEVTPQASFVNDLGADSLDTVELVMALEDEFEQEISDEDAEKITTVQQAYDFVADKLGLKDKKPVIGQGTIDDAKPASNKLVPFQAISLPSTLMVVRDGKPLQIDKSHTNFEKINKIVANVKNGQIYEQDLQTLYNLIDLKSSLSKFSQGRITVDDTGVKVDGKPLHGDLANLMINTLKGGDMTRLGAFAKFHDKMMEAISFKVTKRLFTFVSKTGLRIDDDGDIIALKVVRNTYFDKHSNTMDNTPGNTVQVARNQVDDDDNQTCSYGLHVCAPGYIKHFSSSSGGDKLVEVKVDPRDFVAIPPDYDFDKARCCKYVVLQDVSSAYKKELYNTKD